jgi:hypothetical protein
MVASVKALIALIQELVEIVWPYAVMLAPVTWLGSKIIDAVM